MTAAAYALGCTNFIVGKKASTDGSVICSYNADSYGAFMALAHYPAAKHQTSDRGYWGDLFNLKFEYLYTEIQVKSYRNFYAANPEDVCRPVLGDSLYNVIHTESGVEPGLSHYYYEIIRADTTSEATREYYKKLSIEYSSHFDPDPTVTQAPIYQ